VSLLDLYEVLLHKVGVSKHPVLLHVPPARCYLLELVTSIKYTDKRQLFKKKWVRWLEDIELGTKQNGFWMLNHQFPVSML
jgi:hypothetical protein